MEELSKSQIMNNIYWALQHRENLKQQYLQKKTKDVISVQITITEQESFTDANGVKWVRS